MKLIILTPETFLPGEAEILNRLFEAGIFTLHLRKPGSSQEQLRPLLNAILPEFHSNIVLHDHFPLTNEYKVKGVHLNRRNPEPPNVPGLSVSKSCHSLQEVKDSATADYVFLSPIFDSISKSGYHRAFSHEELIAARDEGIINKKVIALGGIDETSISMVRDYGFGGIALLGGFWIAPDTKLLRKRLKLFLDLLTNNNPEGTRT